MVLTWELLIMPVIGALIGWLTNVLAIKMLFWPKKPIRIWGVPIELLGLLPKRKKDLAVSVGQTVNQDLLPIDEVLGSIDQKGYQEDLVTMIVGHVDQRLKNAIPRFIPENAKQLLRDFVCDIVARESMALIQEVSRDLIDKAKEEANFGDLVQAKIEGLDLDQLEDLIRKIASTELRHIEILGAVLGFLIGLFQAALLYWRIALY